MTEQHRRVRIAVPFVIAALVLGACGGDDDDAGSSTTAAGATTSAAAGATTTAASAACTTGSGGALSVATASPPAGIDPVRLLGDGTVGADELVAFYDTLMVFDNDTGTYQPRLAKSLTANADSSVWKMELRPGVTFGNGHPLNAAAVKASIDRFRDPANRSSYAAFVANIADIQVVGDLDVTFQLTGPWPGFPYLLADGPGMIADPAVVAQKGFADFGTDPTGAGAGAFEFDHWAPGEEMVFKAKDDYWGGPVCLESLTFVPIGDPKTMEDAFGNGEIDAGITTDAILAAKMRDAGTENFSSLHNAAGALLVNNRAGMPTSDVRVRQAVAAAIDVDALNGRVRDGKGLATSAIIVEPSRYYQGLDGPKYDPALATSLVTAVKAEGKWDGSISLLCTASGEETAIAIAGMLEAVGFDVTTEATLSVTDMLARVFGTGNYQLNCWGLAASDANMYPTLYQNFLSTSPGNTSGYVNPQMDAALAQLKAAPDVAAAKTALSTIQTIWNTTVPMILTNANEPALFWSDDVQGITFSQRLVAYFDQATVG